jgi:hypothetical protein
LAGELFLAHDPFANALSRFPDCHAIVPYLQASQAVGTLERALETLQSEAAHDSERHAQLAAIRYYLHFVIWECERDWTDVVRVAGGSTNYVTLFDQLRRVRGSEPVSLVTFNYDRMIETALRSPPLRITIDTIPGYIADDTFKLFKLHGSVHWAREVETPIVNIETLNEWQVAQELITQVAGIWR